MRTTVCGRREQWNKAKGSCRRVTGKNCDRVCGEITQSRSLQLCVSSPSPQLASRGVGCRLGWHVVMGLGVYSPAPAAPAAGRQPTPLAARTSFQRREANRGSVRNLTRDGPVSTFLDTQPHYTPSSLSLSLFEKSPWQRHAGGRRRARAAAIVTSSSSQAHAHAAPFCPPSRYSGYNKQEVWLGAE